MSLTRRAPSLAEPADMHVRIMPMKRRHLRGVMRIDAEIGPVVQFIINNSPRRFRHQA